MSDYLDYRDKFELLLHNGGKEDYVWCTGDPSGHLLVLKGPVWLKSMGKYNNPVQAG